MRHFSFNVRHFYSLVMLKNFIPKEANLKYKPVLYPPYDRKIFGFFHTKVEKLNPEGEFKRKEVKDYLSRWNPKRKNNKIYYFLTNTFLEEEKEIEERRKELNNNKIPTLKEVTLEAFKSLNQGLKIAGAPFELHPCSPKFKLINNEKKIYFEDELCKEKAKDQIGLEGALSGDIRYNTISLIRPSLGNGLLGYGPNVVHPETGEILHAHVNMYEGNLKRQTRSLWTKISSLENKKWLERKDESLKKENGKKTEEAKKIEDNPIIMNNNNDSIGSTFEGLENRQDEFNLTNDNKKNLTFNELLSNFKKAKKNNFDQNLFFADFLNISETQKSIVNY